MLNPFNTSEKLVFKTVVLALLILFAHQTLLAQRFNFTHYDIEDGLAQSQVRAFAQSPSHHIWMATQGGVSRFDGSLFTSLTRSENGLAGLIVNALLADKNGRIYIGTQDGLSVYDGKSISNYRLPSVQGPSPIRTLVKDKSGRIYGLIKERLFVFSGNKITMVRLPLNPDESVTALTTNADGTVYAAVYGKGIYELRNNNLTLKIGLSETTETLLVRQLLFDRDKKDKLWVLTSRKVFVAENKQIVPFKNSMLDSGEDFLLSLAQDEKSNLWIGASMGAFCIGTQNTTFYNSVNGFTDNAVNVIFKDAESNIWFGTDGAGVYKYDGDKTMILDRTQGLTNEIVMGFAKDNKASIWFQSIGRNIDKLEDGKMTAVKLPFYDTFFNGISQLFTDRDGSVWIGTLGAGLWKYDGVRFKNYPYQEGKVPKIIRNIMQDKYGTIWLATPTGCYTVSNGEFSHVKMFKSPATGVVEIGADSILVSTETGNYILAGKEHRVIKVNHPEFENTELYSMIKFQNWVFFGTGDAGILAWDINSNSIRNLTVRNGLYSNTIYSLIADKKGIIWAGTGRGINKIRFNTQSGNFTISGAETSKRLVVECNQNAVFLDQDKLWFGTTKGAVVFDLKADYEKKDRPHIVLQNVNLFSSVVEKKQEYFSSTDGYSLPGNLALAYQRNQISITFKGIYLTSPSEVLYQYRLLGFEDDFSNPGTNSTIRYQTLSPGKYVFEARALNNAGVVSDNLLRFPFEIETAFYQTLAFKVGLILCLVLSGIGLQAYLHQRKHQRLLLIERLKQEERLKTRRQTAEDFHDDLGNKLTRISILTDILNTKLNGEHPDEKHLISQIKENASSLYRGTKDILWALDPKSDNLFEILCHISEFGMEIFQDTTIDFSFEGIEERLSNIKLPMEYSRNISMIFKESFNNILRHADASHVRLMVIHQDKSVEICLNDDGKGFNQQLVQNGSGLTNISVRAKRIGAKLEVVSKPGIGTTITLSVLKDLKPEI
jgi:ligand-binding sensor domain-containing protein/signal transduction histidine kinase